MVPLLIFQISADAPSSGNVAAERFFKSHEFVQHEKSDFYG
jgi:hypothetical protein